MRTRPALGTLEAERRHLQKGTSARARVCVCACFYKDLSTARCKPREMLGVTFVITRAEIKGNGAQSSVRTVTVKNGKRFLGRGDDRDGYFSK